MSEVNEIFGESEQPAKENSFNKDEWVNKKIEDRTQAFEMLEKATTELSSPEKLTQYLDVQGRFDRYSVSNALLVSHQMPDATRLGDSAYWKRNGGYVQKGEKAITILEPEEYTKKNGEKGISYNAKKVFDISQTNAKQRYFHRKTLGEKTLVTALLKAIPCKVEISNNLPEKINAQYVPEEDKIFIRQGLSGQEIFRNLAYESAKSVFNKNDLSADNKATAVFCVAYIVCRKNGVEPPSAESLSKTFEGMDSKQLRSVLSQVRDEANNISASVEKTLNAKKRDAR